jgi:chloride channel 3/4/5
MDPSSTSSSSSYRPNIHQARVDDEEDELDLLGIEGPSVVPPTARKPADDDLFGGNPLDNLAEPDSFKRKQKQTLLSQPTRLLTAFTTGNQQSHLDGAPSRSPRPLSTLHTAHHDVPSSNARENGKDGLLPPDWYVEGPGRRVGYEDLTAIDWIFEYTKERQRRRMLFASATGLLGWVRQQLDASQVWVVLVLCGLAVGAIAAAIDVTTDWLGDLKFGYCSADDGGAFYLSKGFCCLGYDEHAKCLGWRPWSLALGIPAGSIGGWFAEYFFFMLFAVSVVPGVIPCSTVTTLTTTTDFICILC